MWIPTNLEHLGFTTVNSDYIVRNAALIGLPVTLVVTALYGFWSSKKTIILSFSVLALALFGFVIAGNSVGAAKAGGVLIIGLVVLAATTPSIALTALIGGIPVVVGIAIFAWAGFETHSRRLEEITQVELSLAGAKLRPDADTSLLR